MEQLCEIQAENVNNGGIMDDNVDKKRRFLRIIGGHRNFLAD